MSTRPSPAQGIQLRPGAHASMVYRNPAQLDAALAFVSSGVHRREACVVLAYGRFNERVGAQLRDLYNVDLRRAMTEGVLSFLNGGESGSSLRSDLHKHFVAAAKRLKGARLLVSLGWGEEGWPDEPELVRFDTQLNALCQELKVAALCLYDARQTNGVLLVEGALECHPVVFMRGEPHKNPFFVEPARVSREMLARRREQSKLQSWIA